MRFDLVFGALVCVPNRHLLCKSLPDQSTWQNFASTAACFSGIGIICAVTRCYSADRKKDWRPQLGHVDRGSIKLKGEVDYDRLARVIRGILSSTSANHCDPMQVSRNS